MPDKNIKLTSHTTNKDHFKLWDTNPSKIIPEYPEFTSIKKNRKYLPLIFNVIKVDSFIPASNGIC